MGLDLLIEIFYFILQAVPSALLGASQPIPDVPPPISRDDCPDLPPIRSVEQPQQQQKNDTTERSTSSSSPPPPLDDHQQHDVRIEDVTDDDDDDDPTSVPITLTASLQTSQPADAATTPSPPAFSVYRSCDSPPSLHFHDPPSLSVDDDQFDDLNSSAEDILDDCRCSDDDDDADDDAGGSHALDIPDIVGETDAEIRCMPAIDEVVKPTVASQSLHDMLLDSTASATTAAETAVTEITITTAATAMDPVSSSPVLDLNDSFEEFVEYVGTNEQPQSIATSTATTAAGVDVNSNQLPTKNPTVDAVELELDDSNDFGADFSQFTSFSAAAEPLAIANSTIAFNNQSSIVVDDDFGDFAEPQNVNDDNDNDDDDFGDFSDFQQSATVVPEQICVQHGPVPISINVQDICARLGPLLNLMFPPSNDSDNDSSSSDARITVAAADDDPIIRTVLNVDDPLALRHQWLQSTGKAELVQALGIDTGKIVSILAKVCLELCIHYMALFVVLSQWNQAMPRFAANLGFTPLEPMKPTDVSCLRPTPVAPVERNSNGSSSSSGNSGGFRSQLGPDVPVAQFDWSGAGLVNPLDGKFVDRTGWVVCLCF